MTEALIFISLYRVLFYPITAFNIVISKVAALTCHLGYVLLRDAHDIEACLHLLGYQRLCWGHEHYLTSWVPPVEIVHYHSSYESFPKACRQRFII